MFCRFLLTHLRDPADAVERWSTQLRPCGILMIEETEAIETGKPLFRQYLSMVEEMLRAQSNRLYAGPAIENLCAASLSLISSDLRCLRVTNEDAAKMFALNLQTWRDTDFIRTNYSSDVIGQLSRELSAAAKSESSASEITWRMRQAVLSR
jgi:hypothetical protein